MPSMFTSWWSYNHEYYMQPNRLTALTVMPVLNCALAPAGYLFAFGRPPVELPLCQVARGRDGWLGSGSSRGGNWPQQWTAWRCSRGRGICTGHSARRLSAVLEEAGTQGAQTCCVDQRQCEMTGYTFLHRLSYMSGTSTQV